MSYNYLNFISNYLMQRPHQWCNCNRVFLGCSKSLVRVPVANTLQLVIDASPVSTQLLLIRAKTGWLGLMIKCPRGAIFLPAHCCFSELAL